MSDFNKFPKLRGSLRIDPVKSTSSNSLQRTDEWFKARSGCFTGSKAKDLMGSGRSTSKAVWGDPAKLFDFSASAEKYIYQVGMERLTGNAPKGADSQQMRWGRENEPLFIANLLKDGIIDKHVDTDFEKVTGLNLGASSDGWCIYKGEKMGFEAKCTFSWDGHYMRLYEDVHDKHNDFWQFQLEMMSLGMDKILYAVADPQDISRYEVKIIHASPLHQKCLLARYAIAEHAISLWDKHSKPDALKIACAFYKEKMEEA